MEYFVRINLEHQGIQELLQVQRELLERLKKAKGVNILHLDNLLSFWRDFLDQEHMSWEEEIAFASFRKLNQSLPERLQGDHERIRAYLGKLEATLKMLRTGRPHSGREFVEWGEELADTVVEHLTREKTALRELSLSGQEPEAVPYLQPTGERQEKLNRLFQVAEELCEDYLQKPTALRDLRVEVKPVNTEDLEIPKSESEENGNGDIASIIMETDDGLTLTEKTVDGETAS